MNYINARHLIIELANRLADDEDFVEYVYPQVIELLIFLEDQCSQQD